MPARACTTCVSAAGSGIARCCPAPTSWWPPFAMVAESSAPRSPASGFLARQRIDQIARCVGVLVASLTISLVTASGAAAASHHLTVMTFNIAHARLSPGGLADVARVVRSARADVVALQEVDRSWSRSGSVDQATELGGLLGMRSEFDA